MNVKCKLCQEWVPEEKLKAHVTTVGSSCRAALETVRFLKEGLRPYPETNTLPAWCRTAYLTAFTRGKYDGEPREDKGFLAAPTRQLWVPRWIDIIVELWSGPIYTEGDTRLVQRDIVLNHVKTMWTSSMKQMIVDARREDLRAVRDLLRTHGAIVLGDAPMLINEFEALGRFQDPRYHQ